MKTYDRNTTEKMEKTYLIKVFVFCMILMCTSSVYAGQDCNAAESSSSLWKGKTIGLFTSSDSRQEGIRWANWGSRPYEYFWASHVVDLQGKKVIDLGVGLPSQYTWYQYVISEKKPAFYCGVDLDPRVLFEEIKVQSYEIRYMDMTDLKYPSHFFDIAFCISTFEHLPYDAFMQSIKEAYRVLNDEGLLILTLDERWDKDVVYTANNSWNNLERSLIQEGLFNDRCQAFGLRSFLSLVEDYFIPIDETVHVNSQGEVASSRDENSFYKKINRDPHVLKSHDVEYGEIYNSCVSFAVLKKIKKNRK